MNLAAQHSIVDALERLPILDRRQRERFARLRGECTSPRALIKDLVRREMLSPYQANQIILGRADELIFNNYVCLAKIGEGGMGHVYKARQRSLDRIVALKVLRRECLDNAKTVQRFQREIRAVGQLRHPNIVTAHDADEANGLQYIAMEYIDGVDLARKVKRGGPIAVESALDYVRQAALGLQHAHDNGLIHRDVKPGNLLVANDAGQRSRFGTVKILDLGLARIVSPAELNLTSQGTLMGTPDFIAPEQATDPRNCDGRADLYALGCTLYYLIAGRIPFPRGGITEKLIHHQLHAPDPLADVRREKLMRESAKSGKRFEEPFYDVPAGVVAIVERLMAKRPNDRFQTGAEVADAIERVHDNSGGDAMTVTATQPVTCESMALGPAEIPLTTKFRPPSWQSLGGASGAIVDVTLPPVKRRRATHWWIVGAASAALISGWLWLHRSAMESPPRGLPEMPFRR
jgi:serine/threonine protein kinase